MNHGPTSAREFMREFVDEYPRRNDRTVIFFPPALTLHTVAEALADRHDILLGVQNVHWEDKGAFTGENAVGMARDSGAHVVLVGHSERRHIFGETDADTARKCHAIVRGGMTPLLCVGETLVDRDAGAAENVVTRQLSAALESLPKPRTGEVMIAYEPVWAIGTGRNASPQDASAMHAHIRAALKRLLGDRAPMARVLYGGSVNVHNAAELLAAPEVDGLLVGGASLTASSWLTVVQS